MYSIHNNIYYEMHEYIWKNTEQNPVGFCPWWNSTYYTKSCGFYCGLGFLTSKTPQPNKDRRNCCVHLKRGNFPSLEWWRSSFWWGNESQSAETYSWHRTCLAICYIKVSFLRNYTVPLKKISFCFGKLLHGTQISLHCSCLGESPASEDGNCSTHEHISPSRNWSYATCSINSSNYTDWSQIGYWW